MSGVNVRLLHQMAVIRRLATDSRIKRNRQPQGEGDGGGPCLQDNDDAASSVALRLLKRATLQPPLLLLLLRRAGD